MLRRVAVGGASAENLLRDTIDFDICPADMGVRGHGIAFELDAVRLRAPDDGFLLRDGKRVERRKIVHPLKKKKRILITKTKVKKTSPLEGLTKKRPTLQSKLQSKSQSKSKRKQPNRKCLESNRRRPHGG